MTVGLALERDVPLMREESGVTKLDKFGVSRHSTFGEPCFEEAAVYLGLQTMGSTNYLLTKMERESESL